MSFKPPASGLFRYLSNIKGVASDEIFVNQELYCLLNGGKLPLLCAGKMQNLLQCVRGARCSPKEAGGGVILLFHWSGNRKRIGFPV